MNHLNRCVRVMLNNCVKVNFKRYTIRMCSSKGIRKFYKEVSLTKSNGRYEINLDRHKLRTPLHNIIQIPSEPLALGVAEEWRMQEDYINRYNMQLTSLAYKCTDGKEFSTQEETINRMLEYLNTDTVCFRADDPAELAMQEKNWGPLIKWTEKRFEVKIPVTSGLSVPNISMETRKKFVLYLKSFSDWALTGYEQAVECLKSFVIATAVVNKQVSVEEAVKLSSLELEFQTNVWGTVEWKHTVDETEMKARLAAAVLFVHFNSCHYNVVGRGEEQFSTKRK